MQLENGDYFAVTRGFAYNMSACVTFGRGAEPPEQQYDRSYDGIIFRAASVSGPLVAAQIVYTPTSKERYLPVGLVISLNTTENEVMTVGDDYLDAMGIGLRQKHEASQ